LRVGVVGIGKMGLLHASILNVIPEVELAAFCDRSFLIRRFLKKAFKEVVIMKDVDKLARVDLDAVYVTTPIFSHYPVVKALYSENVASNLFVEKTLASRFDEAEELCGLAEKFGGVNMVGYMRRFAVTFRKAKDLLDKKVIGEPVHFEAYAYSSDFYGMKGNSKSHTCNVGVVRDLGCHAIDLALWFFGELSVEDAKVVSLVNDGIDDNAVVEVETSSGLTGELHFSWCVAKHRMPEVGFLIKGSEGVLKVNDDKVELSLEDGNHYKWLRHDLQDTVAFWLGGPEYFREDEHFVKSIVYSWAAEPSFRSGAKVERIIDEIKAKAS
jgi:predicted dehydrogenase